MLNDIWESHCVTHFSQKQKRSNPKVRSLPVYREILGEIPPFLVADATAAGSASWCPLSLRLLHETCETGPPAPEPRSPSSRCLCSLTSLEFAASLSFCCSLFRLTAWAASIVCRVQLDDSLHLSFIPPNHLSSQCSENIQESWALLLSLGVSSYKKNKFIIRNVCTRTFWKHLLPETKQLL